MAKWEIPDDNWTLKRQEIANEHHLEQAPQDLCNGWKTWLNENGPAKSGAGAGKEAVPASGPSAVANELPTDRQRIEAFTQAMNACQLSSIPAETNPDQFASI